MYTTRLSHGFEAESATLKPLNIPLVFKAVILCRGIFVT